jgi:hypothetical protein
MVFRATSIRLCSAAIIPTPASNNIQYTAQFGNGVSGTIGLDDPTVWNRTAVYNLSIPTAIGANGTSSNASAGVHSPGIVGNIRVDQAWGLFQISAAAHEVSGSYNTLGASAVPTNASEVSDSLGVQGPGYVFAAAPRSAQFLIASIRKTLFRLTSSRAGDHVWCRQLCLQRRFGSGFNRSFSVFVNMVATNPI